MISEFGVLVVNPGAGLRSAQPTGWRAWRAASIASGRGRDLPLCHSASYSSPKCSLPSLIRDLAGLGVRAAEGVVGHFQPSFRRSVEMDRLDRTAEARVNQLAAAAISLSCSAPSDGSRS